MCNLVNDSILSLVAAGSAIAGGLVTGAYEHLLDWYERPELKENCPQRFERFFRGGNNAAAVACTPRGRVRSASEKTPQA